MEILYLDPTWFHGGSISFRCPECSRRVKVDCKKFHIRGNYATLTIDTLFTAECCGTVFNVKQGIINVVESL